MENIPRQTSFGCFSLKLGSIFTALLIIVYSVLALAQCLAVLNVLPSRLSPEDTDAMVSYGVVITVTAVHAITLFITAVMLVGVLREKPHLIKPWVVWTSIQVTASLLIFVFWSTTNIISHSGESSLILYVVEFLCLTIRFYMLMLVASFYKQLEEGRDETERLRKLISPETWYSSA
ncbi:unnamed protein product [Parnassius mnemosyne]|uniref:Transmembrane protein n=1 Tax=Parnassius mnemosyne TaxID=213953 RepID=A0AAV1KK32_9NEOP